MSDWSEPVAKQMSNGTWIAGAWNTRTGATLAASGATEAEARQGLEKSLEWRKADPLLGDW